MLRLKSFLPSSSEDLLPFLGWIGECRNVATLRADIIAGITVALVLVPQSMAYAQLAGLPPYYGLYASFLPVIVAAMFGSSRQLATGPVAVVSLMTAAALGPMAGGDMDVYVSYAIMLALIVGVFQLLLGIFKLGVLVDFLSHPVVIGFTNAAAIIIGTSQLGKLFGVTAERADHQYETIWNVLVAAMTDTHMMTLSMGLFALALMLFMKRFTPRLPNVLASVAVTTVISWYIGFEGKGGKVVGAVPTGLPSLKVPELHFDTAVELLTPAIIISVIGFMEAISIAKAMAAQSRQKLDANQELIGQGLGNLASSFSQGYAVSGSFSRSAVNLSAGAITGFSSIVTGAVVAATLLWLTPLLYHLPQATLAAVIMMVVINLIKIAPMRHAWKVQPHDGVVAIITFIVTLVEAPHLDTGIMTGVVLSLGLFVYRTMRPRISLLARAADGTLRDVDSHNLQRCENISVISFDGPLYFANTGYFADTLQGRIAEKPDLKFVIIDADAISEIDATGEEMLHDFARRLKALEIELYVARAKYPLMRTLRRSGFVDRLGEDHFFRLRIRALKHAWSQLEKDHADTCPLNVYVKKDGTLVGPDTLKD